MNPVKGMKAEHLLHSGIATMRKWAGYIPPTMPVNEPLPQMQPQYELQVKHVLEAYYPHLNIDPREVYLMLAEKFQTDVLAEECLKVLFGQDVNRQRILDNVNYYYHLGRYTLEYLSYALVSDRVELALMLLEPHRDTLPRPTLFWRLNFALSPTDIDERIRELAIRMMT